MKKIYFISHWRDRDRKAALDFFQRVIFAGIDRFQYREKELPLEIFFDEARILQQACEEAGVEFLVNDRSEVAKSLKCGLHLGQEDGDFPPDFHGLKGRSLRRPAQLEALTVEDHLGVGALFSSSTKQSASLIDRQDLAEIIELSPLPIYLIGGIQSRHLVSIRDWPVEGFCFSSEILKAPDPRDKIKEIKQILGGKNGTTI